MPLRRSGRAGPVLAVVLVTAAAALAGCASSEGAGAPTVFPPWYPLENEAGDPAVADFESHVPCTIDPDPDPDCQRVKFGLVLYRDRQTGEPTTYVMSIIRVGVGDDREVHEGDWDTDAGTPLDTDATVYLLDDAAPEQLRQYWALGEDLLLLLDAAREPRVGDGVYSFTLDSIPVGKRVTVP